MSTVLLMEIGMPINSPYVVAALYKFADFPDYQEFQPKLLTLCKKHKVYGTLLLASEGINGTIAGSREGIDTVIAFIRKHPVFSEGLEYKESFASEQPFLRTKIRLKKEIVTLGVPGVSPVKTVGTYVEPKDWNTLIQQKDVVVIDCRNDYEYEIGTFKGALNPNTETFREFPEYIQKNFNPQKHKRIATFCTGGIRCEKSTSLLKEMGYEEVYHLKGGILKYLEEVPETNSLWQGECFVFDNRVAVTHGVQEGHYDQCYGCRYPVSDEQKRHEHYKEGVHCHRCYNKRSDKQHHTAAVRHRQVQIAKDKGIKHLGR
jgi:UPF0176 protein